MIYLDSSALVKLVMIEPESGALGRFLRGRLDRVSCALARVELPRAVRRHGRRLVANASDVLARTELIDLDDALLDDAAAVRPATFRTLDAIHLAAALTLGDELDLLITYDTRMADATHALGIEVRSPA